MVRSASGKPLSLRALGIWTAIIAVLLAWACVAIVTRAGAGVAMVGIFPLCFIFIGLSWAGRFDRIVPLVIAATLVGLWPLYRWRAFGDWRSVDIYLSVVGFLGALGVLVMGMGFCERRGWIVTSPLRSKLFASLFFIVFLSDVTHWPSGAWHYAVFGVQVVLSLLLLFWPARRQPPRHNQPATA